MEKNEKDFRLEEELKDIEDILFDELDSNKNIVFSNSAEEEIRLTSFGKLIEKLFSNGTMSPAKIQSLFLTYRSFQTPKKLLLALIKRFLTAPEQDQLVIRLRVLSGMKVWITTYWSDFNIDLPILLPILKAFLDQCSKDDSPSMKSLQKAIEAISKNLESQLARSSDQLRDSSQNITLPCSIIDDADLLELIDIIEPRSLAEQLTMSDWAIWRKIQPHEFLNMGWVKQDRHERSPNITKMISRVNLLSKWVTMSIIVKEDVNQRTARIQNWILTVQHLVELKNFNSALVIVSGLSSASVFRLRLSTVSEECQRLLNNFRELFDPAGSYKSYRELLMNSVPPCIPYLGMFLTDLTFVYDTSFDYPGPLIQWRKNELAANVITQVQQYQLVPYQFDASGLHIDQKLEEFVFFTEDQMFQCSRYIEPSHANNRTIPECLAAYLDKLKKKNDRQ